MKALKFLVLGLILAMAGTAQSQLSISLNIGTRPEWGPRGYEQARYYYLPDVDAYYDMNTTMFIYLSGNTWIHRKQLPSRYHDYNLYKGRKLVMTNYRGNKPYFNHKAYKSKYGKSAKQPMVISRKDYGKKKTVITRKSQNNGKNDHKKSNGNNGKKH